MKLSKSLFISFSAVIAFLVCDFLLPKKNVSKFRQPLSTIVRDGEENENDQRTKFENWYNGMHKTAPGVNWKQMDAATREQKYSETRFQNPGTQRNSLPNNTLTQEVLANGNLIGQWNERGSVNNAGRVWQADLDTATGAVYCG